MDKLKRTLAMQFMEMLDERGFDDPNEIAELLERGHEVEHLLFSCLYGDLLGDELITFPENPDNPSSSYAWELSYESPLRGVYDRLSRVGFATVGLLQVVTEDQLASHPGIGGKTVKAVRSYLETRGLRLTDPTEDIRKRVLSVYGGVTERIPIEYIQVRRRVTSRELSVRSIKRFYTLRNVPLSRLMVIPRSDSHEPVFSLADIHAIDEELSLLWPHQSAEPPIISEGEQRLLNTLVVNNT